MPFLTPFGKYKRGASVKVFCFILSMLLLIPTVSAAAPPSAFTELQALSVSAASCVLYDPLTGRYLYEKDADTPRPIASTTKLMTALTVLSCAEPTEIVTIPTAATLVEGSRIYVKSGDKLTVETLLYGLLMASGNDAALALAMHCDENVDAFAARMNELAQEWELTSTHFTNPHGLPDDGHISTARELALIMTKAAENPLLQTIMSERSVTREGYSFTNHNKLLWQLEEADGGKTGFTKAAGRCLCSSASREGRRLICVTLNAADDWNDHIRLFNAVFSNLSSRNFACEGETLATIPVGGSFGQSAAVAVQTDLCYPLTAEETARVKRRLLLPQIVYAPVSSGTPAGTIQLCLDGIVLTEQPLYYIHDVSVTVRRQTLWGQLRAWFQTVSVPFSFSTSTRT